MGAKEARAASLALEGSVRDILRILQVNLLLLSSTARPSRLAPIDPRRQVAVLVGTDVILLAALLPAVEQTVEVELHFGSSADTLLHVSCFIHSW